MFTRAISRKPQPSTPSAGFASRSSFSSGPHSWSDPGQFVRRERSAADEGLEEQEAEAAGLERIRHSFVSTLPPREPGENTPGGLQPNSTGLPNSLKTGIEALSGYALDAVRVRFNSSKPRQLKALAYARGTEIHVAPGQEKHLPHEAWHVVQQMQGRVRPMRQMNGIQINNDEKLEREADVMGNNAQRRGEQTDGLIQLKCSKCAEEDRKDREKGKNNIVQPKEDVAQLANCYFFKNADCTGSRIYAQSKHNFHDYKSLNCSGERGDKATDCEENDGKGHCFCPEIQENSNSDDGNVKSRSSAYDDPGTSRGEKALIEIGLSQGQYPPAPDKKRGKGQVYDQGLSESSQNISELLDDFRKESDQLPPKQTTKKEAQKIIDQQKPGSSQAGSKSPANEKKKVVTPQESEKLKRQTGLTLSPGTLIAVAVVLMALLFLYYGI